MLASRQQPPPNDPESIQTGRVWQFQGLELLLELLAVQLGEELSTMHARK